jgi:aspartyl/asparaginyl beta-hydroxylase (cupin superfamily)
VTVASLYDLSTSAIRRSYDRRVTGAPVLDVESYFPEATRFLDAWPQLRDEALRVAEDLGQVPRFHELMPVAPDGQPAAVLTIDHHEHRIGDGECILWDDTFPHEVLNHGDRVRIALLLDVRRRGMPLDMALLSRALISAVGLSVRMRRRKLDQD